MKIKLVVLCEQVDYLKRLSSGFDKSFTGRITQNFFSEPDKAKEYLKKERVDVFLCDEDVEFDISDIKRKFAFGYLVSTKGIEVYEGEKAICKYQKISDIYNAILDLFSENMPDDMEIKFNNSDSRVVSFLSPKGGVGNSTIALSYAKMLVNYNKAVLYLDLTKNGDCSDVLTADGNHCMSNVIYTLKLGRKNMEMKIESMIRKDACGVCFFQPVNNRLEMDELSKSDCSKLLEMLINIDIFDYIVIDVGFDTNDYVINILKESYSIFVTSDGRKETNTVVEKAMTALEIIENQQDLRFLDQLMIIYNKFNENSVASAQYKDLIIAKIPEFVSENRTLISNQISLGNYLKHIDL